MTKGLVIRFQFNSSSSTKEATEKTRYLNHDARRIVWRNVILLALTHCAAFYGVYMICIGQVKLLSVVVSYTIAGFSGFGITAGAHRLWCHRAYKAKLPFRILLIILNSIAFQNSVFTWCRDHRAHHKFTETDGDPHNSRRGFFFAHMGWLMCKKHPDVTTKGKSIDLSDLKEDPIVMFQYRHYLLMIIIFSAIFPPTILYFILGETAKASIFVGAFLRYVYTLHSTWLVNSAAHMWGYRPYDRSLRPAENIIVAMFAYGEGWHNYHHAFPWDYKTSESPFYTFNLTTAFIDFFASIGWVYDLKSVSEDMVKKRVLRIGDGSHPVWGWGDQDISQQHLKALKVSKQIEK